MTTATAPLSSETGRSHLQESLFSWLAPDDSPPLTDTKARVESAPDGPPEPHAEEDTPDISHVWVVAAEIEVVPKVAKVADYRGSFKATGGQRIDALEVYCKGCRRPYDEVTGQDCAAKIDNRHLIGGDQSTRAKRKVPVPPRNARVVPGGRIQRRGIEAYVGGVSRPPR
ncbi:hypothetical protein [Streptomyces olivaceus]|uniref:hypothetical protein n=1 Tax=Streptomyces olivaceus TaxID=47716 RepID=UPI001CCF3F6F|nr:hypothetical protein [Streptomyces olivaceus]